MPQSIDWLLIQSLANHLTVLLVTDTYSNISPHLCYFVNVSRCRYKQFWYKWPSLFIIARDHAISSQWQLVKGTTASDMLFMYFNRKTTWLTTSDIQSTSFMILQSTPDKCNIERLLELHYNKKFASTSMYSTDFRRILIPDSEIYVSHYLM